jgi:sulfoxide reductase heme-binding subunit YedZ
LTPPSPLWYFARGAGLAVFVLLTATFALGILTAGKWRPPGLPSWINVTLHRNLALTSVLFGVFHATTAILDPFPHLGVVDALIPFDSAYRRIWLGLGVAGAELFLVLIATSLVRDRLGPRTWKAIHWGAYLAWPLALVHALGTGSDEKAGWALAVYFLCVATAVSVLAWRLMQGRPETRTARTLAGTAIVPALAVLAGWVFTGPLQPGWAAAAGTPAALLTQPSPTAGPTATPAPALPAGLDHALQGQLARTPDGGSRITLQDAVDPTYQVELDVTADGSASITIDHSGTRVCTVPASAANGPRYSASCAGRPLELDVVNITRRGAVSAELVTT